MVLTFERARKVFNAMIKENIWLNDPANSLLTRRMRSLGMLTPTVKRFEISSKSTPDQHTLHINFRQVESAYSTQLDDMTAALGSFSLYVVPLCGEVAPENGHFRLRLTRLGFHIMDSYDFTGNQDLGYWDDSTNRASVLHFGNGEQSITEEAISWSTLM